MKRTFLLIVLSLSIIVPSRQASCCTAFSVKNSQGRHVAKNFDWYVGEGLVVVNPRGASRTQALKSAGVPVKWKARYGSVSLTAFAPGFPLSGMNEKGLVVESLHQLDFAGALQAGDGLVSLEWVQYVLDRFSSVAEVKRDIKQNGFGQVLVPVHFFISDASGTNIVVHGQGRQIQVVSGKQMPVPVLANNTYSRDLTRYKKSLKRNWLQDVFSRDRNGGRLGIIARGLKKATLQTSDAVFALLHKARISSLTKWQIVWHQTQKGVTWRFFAHRRPQKVAHIDFKDLDFSCRSRPLVTDTVSGNGVHFAPYSTDDMALATLRVQAIESTLGAPLPADFYSAFAKPIQCQ